MVILKALLPRLEFKYNKGYLEDSIYSILRDSV